MNPLRRRRRRHGQPGACHDPRAPETTSAPARSLTAEAAAALDEALADERQALATYQAAMARFGPIRPFANIARAEERHIGALMQLYRRYGLAVPPPAPPVRPASLPDTPRELCERAVDEERANVALYDARLLPQASAYADVRSVMQRLRDASRFNHLPAFQRCARRP